jgi:TatD DNase family protein
MNSPIIDSHAHLDLPAFKPDLNKVVERAFKAGVKQLITVGIDLVASRRSLEIARSFPGVYAAVGCHPSEAQHLDGNYLKELESMAINPKVVAIGETGLDYFRNQIPREVQINAFRQQLSLAGRLCLPVIVHSRQADSDTVSVLREWIGLSKAPADRPPGVIHCFSGTAEMAETYIRLGFMLSLGAYLGYPGSAPLRHVIQGLPIDHLLLETDSPFLPPQGKRGERNEPSYILATAQVISGIKAMDFEETAALTSCNAIRLFNLREVTLEAD